MECADPSYRTLSAQLQKGLIGWVETLSSKEGFPLDEKDP